MEPPSSGSFRTPGEHRLKAGFFTVGQTVVYTLLSVIDTLRGAQVGSMCLANDCGATQECAPQ